VPGKVRRRKLYDRCHFFHIIFENIFVPVSQRTSYKLPLSLPYVRIDFIAPNANAYDNNNLKAEELEE